MNIFIDELATSRVAPRPDVAPRKFVVEDNVGESIHIHLRNLRLDMTIQDFVAFATYVEAAHDTLEEQHDGNR